MTTEFKEVIVDADFLDFAIRNREGPAFIWIRLGNCRTPILLTAIERRLPEILEELKAGRKVIEIR